jgi:hypothetical protein
VSIEARQLRKPSPSIHFILFEILRDKYRPCRKFSESMQQIGLFIHTLKSMVKEDYPEELLSREMVGISCVMWGNKIKFISFLWLDEMPHR